MCQQTSFTGGFCNSAVPLETKDVPTSTGHTVQFVKVCKKDKWLHRAVGGDKAGRDILKRSLLFEELKEKLVAGEGSPSAAVVPAVGDVDGDDPMSKLGCFDGALKGEVGMKRKSGGKRTAYQSKRSKNMITTIEMPQFERTRHPSKTEKRFVRLLAWGTNQTYVSINDVEWLVNWLIDEYTSGGVSADDSATALVPNCKAPGVHIRWDFGGAWEAIVVGDAPAVPEEQPRTPQKHVKSYVSMLTPEKWVTVDKIHRYGFAFEDASPEQLKQATFHYLENHMVQQVGQ